MPTCPLAVVALVMTGVAGHDGNGQRKLPVPPRVGRAEAHGMDTPAAVGIPEITPVAGSTLRPAGKPLAPKLVGLWLAVI